MIYDYYCRMFYDPWGRLWETTIVNKERWIILKGKKKKVTELSLIDAFPEE